MPNKRLSDMTDGERKATPVYDGCIKYFPNSLALCASHSVKGQQQHGPTAPLQWHREKSQDELGSLSRHLLDYAEAEAKGDYAMMLDATEAIIWRALAHGERFIATEDGDPKRYQQVKKRRDEVPEDAH